MIAPLTGPEFRKIGNIMGIFHFLIVVQGIIASALVGVILMQRSEGGGLGMGGSPSGLMSARGAADFMTRTTTILATAFIGMSVALAFVAASQGSGEKIDASLKRVEAPVTAPASTADNATVTADSKAKLDVTPSATTKAPDKNDVPLDK
jgi:preprotein translocase subunit SecG